MAEIPLCLGLGVSSVQERSPADVIVPDGFRRDLESDRPESPRAPD